MKSQKIIRFLLAFCCVLCVNAFGADSNLEQKITKLLTQKTSQQIKVLKIEDLQSTDKVKFVVIKAGDLQVPLFVSSDGEAVLGASNVFFASNDNDTINISNTIKQTQNTTQKPANETIANLFASLKTSDFIVLDSQNKSNKIVYIVADVNCPSCQREMLELKKLTQDSSVYVLPVGFLGADSVLKAAMLKERASEFKSNDEKIAFLQEVYKRGYKLPKKYENLDVSGVMNINHKVMQAGINSVPYIYEKVR